MSDLLKDKVCLVTGAGKGIGLSIMEEFIKHGAKLSVITRNQKDIENIKTKYPDNSVLAYQGDVTDISIINEFISQSENTFGTIDVLVNNAGIRFRKEFLDITPEEMHEVLDCNYMTHFNMCQKVIPIFLKQGGGKIINMSSIAGSLGLPELSAYVSSKSAIIGLTKALALEFATNNIQINAIAPGFCKTSYYDNFKQNTDLYNFTIERTPMKRWAESYEIANACVFLASDLCQYMTGEIMFVDGGWNAW